MGEDIKYLLVKNREYLINIKHAFPKFEMYDISIKKNKSTLLERPFSESNRPYFKDGSKSSNLIKIDLYYSLQK